jgi:RNA polymerase sigma-70 factor (ECF subfamily)
MKGCLERLRAGDAAAQNELVLRAGDRLERLARRMLRRFPDVARREQTGDVLQNSIMRLLRALRTVEPATTRDFFNLAAAQIRRELLDLAKRRLRPDRAALGLEGNGGGPRPEPAAPAYERDLDDWAAFHEAVEGLPAEEREVVGLVFYHGLGQAEVAALLGVSDRTVRRWWSSACEALRGRAGNQAD